MDIQHKQAVLTTHRKPLVLAIACALSSTVFQASAEEAKPGNQALGIERIVVTAQKREKSLQETPIAISAFSSNTIEDLGIENLADAGNYSPNVSIIPTLGSSYNISMSIRGLATADPSLAIDPKVGIYLDGVYIARNAGAVFDIVDLERMEILRGPQGTLWGKNTTGGAVNMSTIKPGGEFAFSQKLTAGNHGLLRSVTSVETTEVGGLSAKFSYLKEKSDGWATNINPAGPKELGNSDTDAFRLALRYEFNDDITLDYSYDYTDGESVAQPLQIADVDSNYTSPMIPTMDIATGKLYGGNVFAMMADNEIQGGRQEEFNLDSIGNEEVEISGHNLTATWELDHKTTLKSITSYRQYESYVYGLDMDGGTFYGAELDQTYQPTGNFAPIPGFHTDFNDKKQDQVSQEFQLIGTLGEKLDYVVGLYHFDEEGTENNPWAITIFTGQGANLLFQDDMAWGMFYKTESKTNAAFAHVNYPISEKLGLTVGARYTKDEKALTFLSEFDPMLHQDKYGEKDWSKFTTTAILDYSFDADFNVYAKYAEGYASGVFNPGSVNRFAFLQSGQAYYDEGLIAADPEDTKSFELGAKGIFLNDRVLFNSALFLNKNENLQVTDFVNSTRVTINSGKSDITGAEMELVVLPVEGLQMTASLGYIDVDYDSGVKQGVPKLSQVYSARYEFPANSWGTLAAVADYTIKGDTHFSFSDRSLMSEGYSLLNARLSLSDIKLGQGDLSLSLWGRNLADEEYVVHGAGFGFYKGYTYGSPRSFGLDVTYRFE